LSSITFTHYVFAFWQLKFGDFTLTSENTMLQQTSMFGQFTAWE